MESNKQGQSSSARSSGGSRREDSSVDDEYIEMTRKRARRHDPDEDVNGPIRTNFKPDPNSPSSHSATPVPLQQSKPKASTSQNAYAPVETPKSEKKPVPLTNFFEFPTKPLPKIEPMVPTQMGGPIPTLPQQAHYNLHNTAEETSYITSGSVKAVPIPGHKVDSDDEDNESVVGVSKAHRYFKKEMVLTKYKFNYYRYPDMKKLAAYNFKNQIIATIKNNRVVVVEGFTGCGKTTQVPQFILDNCVESGRTCNIVVTQPRRIAAISVARRVCEERGWDVGSVVGYQVGMETRANHQETMITYMTTGVLLQKLIRSRSLSQYSHIIVDEVHERDLETDFLLLVMKKILMDDVGEKESHVKVILMSATLNAMKFSKYFVTLANEYGETAEAPVIKIPASTARFAVEESFIDDIVKDQDRVEQIYGSLTEDKACILDEIYELAVQTIVQFDNNEKVSSIAKNDPRRASAVVRDIKVESRGSVLVFLPGLQEIDHLYKLLNEENRKHVQKNGGDPDHYKWNIVPLHSSITNEEQSKVFAPSQKARRKIILATNIAESSVTVSDVVYVIDFCLTKSLHVDTRTNYSCLRLTWAAVSQCIQRKGRTGRVAPGKVYRLVPRKFYSALEQESQPDMLKSGLETIVLRVKTLDMGSPKDILALAIDPPLMSGIERAVVNLKESGALTIYMTKANGEKDYDTCDGDLTFVGKVMSALPISHQCARLIMLGHVFGVMKECIIIAAGLSVKSPFSTPYGRQMDSYLAKLKWAERSHSDCLALLFVFRKWAQNFGESAGSSQIRNEHLWGRANLIQTGVMKEIRKVTEELHDRIKKHGITPWNPTSDTPEDAFQLTKEQNVMLKVAIAGAFYPNYFHRHRPDLKTYERERSREVNGFDLLSTVYYKGFPPRNNGILYAKYIADRLRTGYDVPRVTTEGQKVLVSFDGSGEKIGPINEGVYRAVKLRQIREKMEFNVLLQEKESEFLEEHLRFHQSRRFRPCPAQIELPGVGNPRVYVIATHVENPGQFYVVYKQYEPLLESITNLINNNLTGVPLSRSQLIPGLFCVARDRATRTYYRAKIKAINDSIGQVLVYFVDYGNSDWVETSMVEAFSPFHEQHELAIAARPALAVQCRLSEIKPAVVFGSVWHHDAINNFKQFANNAPRLHIEIYCVVKSVIVGTLFGEDDDGVKFNVNEQLVKDLHADRVQENYNCKLNNSARNRFDLMRDDPMQIRAHNKEQIEVIPEDLFIIPPADALVRTELKGPWSPLELEFMSLCHSSSSKQVVIDHQSVNSVSLDQEPSAPTSRLVVAASVAIQDKSGRVSARDTTMMPAIPGLLALLSMVFTPKMELRVDQNQSKYTGVLCGLGMDPTNNAAVYQDHDVEIVFDTEITDDDVHLINRIRYFMNLILREQTGATMGPTHKSVVEDMFKLLKKDRKRMEEEIWPQESYVWNRINEAFVQPSAAYTSVLQPTDIFLPHSTITLHNNTRPDVSWNFDV